MKRFLILILVFSLLLSLPSCGKGEPDYVTDDITDWFDLLLSEITGGTYHLDLPNEITDEDVQKELRWLQLYYAMVGNDSSKDVYTGTPEFTDIVSFYYDVALTPDGDSVFSNLFSANGAERITVGLWEFPEGKMGEANALFDNKIFSDALTQTVPASRVKEGVVEENDVVVLEYGVLNENNVLLENPANVRIDTNAQTLKHYESIYPTPILSELVGKTLGEEYTIEHSFIPEGGTEEITYTYKYKISHKMQEDFCTVAIPLAEDAFNEDYNDILQGLNGKTVYVRYSVSSYADFDPPKLDSSFFIDTLGFETDETDPVKIEQKALASIKVKLEQTRLTEQVYPIVRNAVFDRIFERTDRVKSMPKNQVEKVYNDLLEEVKATYESEKVNFNFPYADINDFAAAYLNYSLEEYPTIEDVCRAEAEGTVTLWLANFAIAQLAGIRYTPERCEEYYVTYLQYQINGYTDLQNGISISDEERAQIYSTVGDDKTDQLYEELLHLFIKYYSVHAQTEFTLAQMKDLVGTKEDLLFEGLLSITEINVQQYLYENNVWIDTTP